MLGLDFGAYVVELDRDAMGDSAPPWVVGPAANDSSSTEVPLPSAYACFVAKVRGRKLDRLCREVKRFRSLG